MTCHFRQIKQMLKERKKKPNKRQNISTKMIPTQNGPYAFYYSSPKLTLHNQKKGKKSTKSIKREKLKRFNMTRQIKKKKKKV